MRFCILPRVDGLLPPPGSFSRTKRSYVLSSIRSLRSEETRRVLDVKPESQFQGEPDVQVAVATIAGTATAVPPFLLTRDVVKHHIKDVFSLDGKRLEAIHTVIDNSQIDQRHSVFPVEYIIEPRPLAQINNEYREKAFELGLRAAAESLAKAEMVPSDVDLLMTVSCTGVMIPSLDAYLATEMGFRPDVRRLPVTELGCAAGAAGLAHAGEYLRAFPERTA